jgi:hypothetical protein
VGSGSVKGRLPLQVHVLITINASPSPQASLSLPPKLPLGANSTRALASRKTGWTVGSMALRPSDNAVSQQTASTAQAHA